MQQKAMLGGLVMLGLLCFAPGARASTVSSSLATDVSSSASLFTLGGDMPGSRLVQGSSATVTTITVNEAGTLWFTLTDKNFSNALGALSFALTSADAVSASMLGSGTVSMVVNGPMTLYADVFATAQGVANVGLYNLQMGFTPAVAVPLPASALLLAGAMLAWRLQRRSPRPLEHNCHTAVA